MPIERPTADAIELFNQPLPFDLLPGGELLGLSASITQKLSTRPLSRKK